MLSRPCPSDQADVSGVAGAQVDGGEERFGGGECLPGRADVASPAVGAGLGGYGRGRDAGNGIVFALLVRAFGLDSDGIGRAA